MYMDWSVNCATNLNIHDEADARSVCFVAVPQVIFLYFD
jgi:hypothetical protein